MDKLDPYKNKEKFMRWKNKIREAGIIEWLSPINSELVIKYLNDMELGINTSISSKKGSRSYIRLNCLRMRLIFLLRKIQEHCNLDDITQITETQLCSFFVDMRNGVIKRLDGKEYMSIRDFVKVFKAFWHWWMLVSRKLNQEIRDITIYIDSSGEKPRWVYLNEEQIKKLYDNISFKYRTLIMFLFDTGIRAPTELMNIRKSDFSQDYKELNIRDEISKTFGRRIKLMLSSDLIKRYCEDFQINDNDYLFTTLPCNVNRYLRRNARKILGDELSLAGQRYSELTMYDFRHCSCCYWLPRYKSESALKYRFGWKKSDKIHYYSELLGMRDTISEDDLLTPDVKTEVEKELVETKNENSLLKEELIALQEQMKEIFSQVTKLSNNIVILNE